MQVEVVEPYPVISSINLPMRSLHFVGKLLYNVVRVTMILICEVS